ncbi:MAG: DnaJ domain-containing protein [Clostridia bacterium]|nr:DnaJ domain-containing protein [Clostridia bacterium]
MRADHIKIIEIKKTLRSLKKAEIRIRCIDCPECGDKRESLVWDEFFDIKDSCKKPARYTLMQLAEMEKQGFKKAIEEFYWNVYYRLYKESYLEGGEVNSAQLLYRLGLPEYADIADIKSRFRELSRKYHPDAGGTEEEFIELYNIYEELKSKYLH